ncbi:hypothetical protein CFP56_038559 [Quercus suber]|uniref:Uncharacterized protein n=1 Tax=Quercus suber TaxID=58331 RepID=A0AAW0LN57_QUESU
MNFRLHTLRIGREGRNGHGHILLTVGLDMVLYFDSIPITYTSLYIFACVLFMQGETIQGTSEEKKTRMIFDGQESVLLWACNSTGSFCDV